MDFDALATRHKDAIYRQMVRTCGNREDAEDVLIDALLKAYRSIDQLHEADAFRAWLAQIARRVCWQLKRREALQPVLQLSMLEEEGQALVSRDPRPEEQAALAEMRALLAQAVDSLSEEEREVYRRRDLEGQTGPDVARALGLSLAAEKSRLHRARAHVRRFLDRALTARAAAAPAPSGTPSAGQQDRV